MCFHGNRLSRQGPWGSAEPWRAVRRDIPAWSMALFLEPWVLVLGEQDRPCSCLSLLSGSGGAEQEPLATQSLYWEGKRFRLLKHGRIQTYLSQPGMEPRFSTQQISSCWPFPVVQPLSCGHGLIPFSLAPLPCPTTDVTTLLFGCHQGKAQHLTQCL